MRSYILALIVLCSLPGAVRSGSAAEFSLDGPRTLLRRLQYCEHCGSALLVTHVHTGAHIRCPDCGREQSRLADKYLIIQLYQVCRLCQAPLDSKDHQPGDAVECGNCHTRQTLSRDAFATGPDVAGLGYVPGHPPGTGEKSLLLARTGKVLASGPPPVDEPPALPPPSGDFAAVPVPRPPAVPVPLPDLGPRAAPAPPSGPSVPQPPAVPMPTVEALPPPAPDKGQLATLGARKPADAGGSAIEVPAVTVDMFGGKRRDQAGKAVSTEFKPTGPILARVNGEPIYAMEVSRIVEPTMRLLREQAAQATAASLEEKRKELSKEVLERLIDRLLAVREASALGHRPDPAAVRERENELARLLAGQPVDVRLEAERDIVMADMRRLVAQRTAAVSPETVREFYRKHRDEMTNPRQLAISLLVVFQDRSNRRDSRDYRTIAAEVSAALERGERFDDLRAARDEFGPATGLPPGPPPLQPESAYASHILLAAGDLRRGAVFGPLFMEGMALFGKVVDERPAGPLPFEEVETEIRRRLESASEEEKLEAWLARLREKAKVEYYGPQR